MIRLCNRTGWTYSFNKIESGSIFKISWSGDGTTLAGAGVIKLIGTYFSYYILYFFSNFSYLG